MQNIKMRRPIPPYTWPDNHGVYTCETCNHQFIPMVPLLNCERHECFNCEIERKWREVDAAHVKI